MDQLRKDGWYINESQTSQLFDDELLPKNGSEIEKVILNEDLRNFGEASIINLLKKEDFVFEGPCVLQLLRYRNVSVPRIKEELNQTDPAHSIIRLFFTDGHSSISALLLQSIPGITSDTPPGTKILILGKVDVEGGFLILGKKDIRILGGKVDEMIEKWNVEKSSVRAGGFKSSVGKGTGAPKWISFGKRGQKGQLEKGFKANSVMPKTQKEGEDADDDFSKNRAEILKDLDSDTAKTFAKPNLAPPPVKAPAPPKERRVPAARPARKGRGRKNSEDGPDVDVGEYANHKPSGPATLFDFIGGGAGAGASEKAVELLPPQNVQHLTEKMGKLNVKNSENFKYPGAGGRRDQRPAAARDDNRGPKNSAPQNQRPAAARDGNRGPKNPGPQNRAADYFRDRDRQQRPSTGSVGQQPREVSRNFQNSPRSFNQNSNQGHPRGNQKSFQQGAPHQTPRGNQGNFQQQGPPRGTGNYFFQQGPPRGGQFHGGSQQGPPPPPPSQHHPRGFQQQAQQNPPPRGNNQGQSYHGAPRGMGNFGHQEPRNVQQSHQQQTGGPQWRVGAQCLATWTDGNLYPATVTELLPNRTAIVRYNEYGNMHTIPVDFLIIP